MFYVMVNKQSMATSSNELGRIMGRDIQNPTLYLVELESGEKVHLAYSEMHILTKNTTQADLKTKLNEINNLIDGVYGVSYLVNVGLIPMNATINSKVRKQEIKHSKWGINYVEVSREYEGMQFDSMQGKVVKKRIQIIYRVIPSMYDDYYISVRGKI